MFSIPAIEPTIEKFEQDWDNVSGHINLRGK